jgi:hypothetical protein
LADRIASAVRRWALRILWELRSERLTSRALRTACDDASPTILQTRLSELREAGFVELVPAEGYGLTPPRPRAPRDLPAAASFRRALARSLTYLSPSFKAVVIVELSAFSMRRAGASLMDPRGAICSAEDRGRW